MPTGKCEGYNTVWSGGGEREGGGIASERERALCTIADDVEILIGAV